jgi:hypothetical protein
MPIDPSIQRKVDAMGDEMKNLRQSNKDAQSAASDKLKNDLEMIKDKRQRILDAEKLQQKANQDRTEEVEMVDFTDLVERMLDEKAATGGFDYEKTVNDKLKKAGKADKDSTTAGSSADAPDAKFTHNGKSHNLEIKQNHKAMYGQIELHHNGKEWDVSERSKKKYPETHKAIHDSGFLKKVNKQWDKPTGDYDKDLKMGNVYHDHHNADPIKSHYGKDRKTDYIQIGGGHGFYHTGKDSAKLGSPELEGKTQFRARMKYRGTDKKTGKKKYGATVVMGLKDAPKSHHDLDAPTQKEWIEDVLNGHKLMETKLNPKNPHEDYKAKKKALYDLSLNKDVDQKHVQQAKLDLEKEYEQHRVVRTESHAPTAPSIGVHRIAVQVSDPDHPMVSQRNETQQKFVRVTHHDANKAIEVGKRHFSKKGWKVHDAWHAGNVHESLEEAHKIGDKVQITGGSAKGTVGHIGEIRHGLYKGAPKTITVYHGEKDATQVKQHLVKRVNEDTELDEGLKHHVAAAAIAVAGALGGHAHAQSAPAHDTAKPAVTAPAQDSDKSPHDGAPKSEHKARIDKAQADGTMTRGEANVERMKHGLNPSFGRARIQSESVEELQEEHLVHVNDGSKYGDKPHDTDVAHVMAGVKKHGGEFDGHSDKGAFFKFKSHDDAKNFKKHVNSCPHKSCDADLMESDASWAAAQEKNKEQRLTTKDQKTLSHIRAMLAKEKKPVKEEAEQIDEISQKLAGNYYGTATKKHIDKVGVKPNMYDRIEKDMGKNRKAGVDRAMDRLTGQRKTNEEAEQIDELSSELLQSYKDKAKKSAADLADKGQYGKSNDRLLNHMKATGKQIDKTTASISKALRKEETELSEGAYEKAEENKKSADAAMKQGDMFAHHLHMADHHDNLAQWHGEKGRHGEADRHAQKAEQHHEKAMTFKEEVAANSVTAGGVAGFKGDAGKKVKMMSEPLKRKPLTKFSLFVSQEHDR